MTKVDNVTGWYTNVFASWRTADYGGKPTVAMLAQVHNLGCRPGKQALAIACTLRPHGITGSQIVQVCGAPQLNKMRGLISDGLLKREAHEPDGNNHTVYKCVVTAKGEKRIAKALEVAAAAVAKAEGDKPVKVASKRKPKAKPVEKPVEPEAHVTPVPPPVSPVGEPAETHAGM